ncbi:hypothetical protein [Kitasatospora sp. NPDC059571]|uniref:hypothetical protein n=1 Tax=Kitasatospora sp. NPDC059571 TaxID=3346871 RepID=UPI0036AB06A8
MSEPDPTEVESLWTTERDQFELWRLSGGRYLPMRKGDPPMAQLICDDGLHEPVVERMVEAGVEIVDPRNRSAENG